MYACLLENAIEDIHAKLDVRPLSAGGLTCQ